jgi:hypothetical protein
MNLKTHVKNDVNKKMKNIITNMSCLYEHMKITENKSEKKCVQDIKI